MLDNKMCRVNSYHHYDITALRAGGPDFDSRPGRKMSDSV